LIYDREKTGVVVCSMNIDQITSPIKIINKFLNQRLVCHASFLSVNVRSIFLSISKKFTSVFWVIFEINKDGIIIFLFL
jgi:hypothetical protein